MAARRGKKRALVAVGHTELGIAYHMRKRGQPYRDLGGHVLRQSGATPRREAARASVGTPGLSGHLAAECDDGLRPLFSEEILYLYFPVKRAVFMQLRACHSVTL